MKSVWIFGDSYSDIGYDRGNEFTWVKSLHKRYNVRNFSKFGTGPDWSLELLHKEILNADKESLKNVNVIFLISDVFRFNFSFYNETSHQVLYKYIVDRYNLEKNSIVNEEISQYKKYKEFCNSHFMYAHYDNFGHISMIKNLGALSIYSKFFEKILAWPIFYTTDIDIPLTEKFFYVPCPLFNFEKIPPGYGMDSRANHISKENHVVMLEALSNWIDNNKLVDCSKFVRL